MPSKDEVDSSDCTSKFSSLIAYMSWFLDPECGSHKASLVVLLLGITSIKVQKLHYYYIALDFLTWPK